MINDAVKILGHRPAMPFMAGLGAAGLRSLARPLRSVDGGFDDVRDVFSGR